MILLLKKPNPDPADRLCQYQPEITTYQSPDPSHIAVQVEHFVACTNMSYDLYIDLYLIRDCCPVYRVENCCRNQIAVDDCHMTLGNVQCSGLTLARDSAAVAITY